MSEPFLAEIKLFSFNFPPKGWAFCNGQLLPINQNQALFSLLGTTYGGNGQTNFALPNLQGRTPVHVGEGVTLGEAGGAESHTLSAAEMPQHMHVVRASASNADTVTTSNRVLARTTAGDIYRDALGNAITLNAATISTAGGGQPHSNMQPYLVLNFCIALQGIFPPRN